MLAKKHAERSTILQIVEEPYARRLDIDLPENLMAARLDKDALETLEATFAKQYYCLPWRAEGDTLIALLPDDFDEQGWEEHCFNTSLQFRAEADSGLERVVFRTSGLETTKHLEVIDFLYRRADSNISCVNMFEFVCPMQWNALTPTADPFERHCHECKRDVHLVANEKEFENRAQTGDCVAYVPPLPYPTRPDIPDMIPQPIMAGAPMPYDTYNEPPPRRLTEPPPPPTDDPVARGLQDDNGDDGGNSPDRTKRKWWNPFGIFGKGKE